MREFSEGPIASSLIFTEENKQMISKQDFLNSVVLFYIWLKFT